MADAVMATTWLAPEPPRLPRKDAPPKAKMPPSAAVNQYPVPVGVAVMPTMGWLSLRLPVDP